MLGQQYEIADYHRDDFIYGKDRLLVPFPGKAETDRPNYRRGYTQIAGGAKESAAQSTGPI